MMNMTLLSFSCFNGLLGAWSIPVYGVLSDLYPQLYISRYVEAWGVFLSYQEHLSNKTPPPPPPTLLPMEALTAEYFHHGWRKFWVILLWMLQNEGFLMIVGEYFHHGWRKFWVLLLWTAPEWRISMISGSELKIGLFSRFSGFLGSQNPISGFSGFQGFQGRLDTLANESLKENLFARECIKIR